MGQDESGSRTWDLIVRKLLTLPWVKVDRNSFLYSQLQNYCDDTQVRKAIDDRPANAGISPDLIDRLADSCIKRHVSQASAISFLAGLPPGPIGIAAIIPDLGQFYGHAWVLSQKLMYLYGWPQLSDGDEADEETKARVTLLLGVMMGAKGASKITGELAERLAEQIIKRVPRQALTKTAYYPIIKEIGKWIGIKVTKLAFARGISRFLWITGAAISATLTWAMMKPGAKRLKSHLRQLRLAYPDDDENEMKIEA